MWGEHLLTLLQSATNWGEPIWRIFYSLNFPELILVICWIFPPKLDRFHITEIYVIRYNSLFLNGTNQRKSANLFL
jgi:hypothetical protein